jgi:hypothetical protein
LERSCASGQIVGYPDPVFRFLGRGTEIPAASAHLRRLQISRPSGEGESFLLETESLPIFLRATMPQVQSPETGEGSRCGRFRVYLATRCVVLENKADMQKRGQASPDDGDALALTFAQPVAPAEVEEPDEEEEFGSYGGHSSSGGGGWMR